MSVERPPKRRKYDENPPVLPGEEPWTSLSIRLCKTVQEQLGVDSPVFMKVDEVEYQFQLPSMLLSVLLVVHSFRCFREEYDCTS